MKRLLIIIMITLIGPLVRSEYSAYGQPYLDVEAFGEGFAVLEAEGKINFYNSASEHTSTIQTEGVSGAKFTCSVSDALVIAGESSLSCLLDGRWLPMDVPESSRITCLTAFYGGVMAASEDGKLLFWGSPFDKAQIIKTEVSGRFIDMDSFADRCYAVTDRSEIVSIGLNLHPNTFDFNAYYPELRRTRLHPGRNTLAANIPNGKALRSFPGRYVGALAPGGERSGEMESTAHTLT